MYFSAAAGSASSIKSEDLSHFFQWPQFEIVGEFKSLKVHGS